LGIALDDSVETRSLASGDIELTACRFTVVPDHEGALLPGSGRAVQAWWLGLVRESDPDLAGLLHAGSARRPFSCSPLFGLPSAAPGSPAPVLPGREYQLRLAAWDPRVAAHLAALCDAPPAGLVLGGVPFTIRSAAPEAGAPPATFAALAARYLLPPSAPARAGDLTLRFESATSFRQSDAGGARLPDAPFPLPSLVWRGLFDRWQDVSPVQLDPDVRDVLATRISVSRFAGESQRVLLPGVGDPRRLAGATGGRWVVGYTGRCAYWWPRRDGYLGGVLRLLAAFAEYAGVGQGTAYGLGQTRWERPRAQD
jgi:CRISPR-associated endoribonuclease Cas6